MRRKGLTVCASKVVSKQFADDFELVTNAYKLKELGEYELAKEVARNDLENAIPCFAEMAKQIREDL